MTPHAIERFGIDTLRDPRAALQALRKELEAAQGPLVEELADGGVRVTFVHIAPASEVRLFCQLLPLVSRLGHAMNRVPGTDVWWLSVESDARVETTYQFQVDPPGLSQDMTEMLAVMGDPERLATLMREVFLASYADPFNPRRAYPLAGVMGADPDRTARDEHWDSVLVLPGASPFPYTDAPERAGRLTHHELDCVQLPGARTVSVYTPPGYDPGSSYPLVVMLDGEMALACGRLDEVLDAAISDGAVPPVVVAFWHNLTITSRMVEMACNPGLPAALADCLLPFLRAGWSVAAEPASTAVAGMSYGGLAAAYTALERSDAFGAAVVMSPSLWFAPPGEEGTPAEAPGWLTRQYATAPERDVRFAVAVGTLEDQPIPMPGMESITMVSVARAFRDTLLNKNYDLVSYVEQPGGHDLVNVQRVLVGALRELFA
jgi:enterochelin esterase-like enzyme